MSLGLPLGNRRSALDAEGGWPFETNDQAHRTGPPQSVGCPYRVRRDLHLAHCPALGAGGPLAAPVEFRPTGSAGAALTEIGRVSPGLHVTVQAEPLIRKSSVWVAQSWIGPGRSVLTTEAAARRSHSSTRHITGVSTVISPPGEPPTIPIPAAGPRLASCDPALGVFFVLLLAPLLFYRLRRLLGHRLAGRLVCHVCPLSSTPPYSRLAQCPFSRRDPAARDHSLKVGREDAPARRF